MHYRKLHALSPPSAARCALAMTCYCGFLFEGGGGENVCVDGIIWCCSVSEVKLQLNAYSPMVGLLELHLYHLQCCDPKGTVFWCL